MSGIDSDWERELFTMWSWTYDHVRREWVAPRHTHSHSGRPISVVDAMAGLYGRAGVAVKPCEMTLSIDDVVRITQTPEGEGALVGLVMSHGVRKR